MRISVADATAEGICRRRHLLGAAKMLFHPRDSAFSRIDTCERHIIGANGHCSPSGERGAFDSTVGIAQERAKTRQLGACFLSLERPTAFDKRFDLAAAHLRRSAIDVEHQIEIVQSVPLGTECPPHQP